MLQHVEDADRVQPGAEFVGTRPEGDKVAFAPKELPRGGLDIADVPVYWELPSGRVECWSVARLADATADELAAEDGRPEYEAVALEFGFKFLGTAKPDALAALLKEPGTLAERRWEGMTFDLPESSLAGCWWLTNPIGGPRASAGGRRRSGIRKGRSLGSSGKASPSSWRSCTRTGWPRWQS